VIHCFWLRTRIASVASEGGGGLVLSRDFIALRATCMREDRAAPDELNWFYALRCTGTESKFEHGQRKLSGDRRAGLA